jgi:hypothetical protein
MQNACHLCTKIFSILQLHSLSARCVVSYGRSSQQIAIIFIGRVNVLVLLMVRSFSSEVGTYFPYYYLYEFLA